MFFYILNGRAFLVLKYLNLFPYGVFIKVDLSRKCIWDNECIGFERGKIWSIHSCLPYIQDLNGNLYKMNKIHKFGQIMNMKGQLGVFSCGKNV
jgi:hypothetical protein